MKCDLCKQELASDELVSLLGTCTPVSQEKADEYGDESFIWEAGGYVLTLCMDCSSSWDSLFQRMIVMDLEASCPICNPEGLCPSCHKEKAWREREGAMVDEAEKADNPKVD